MTHSWIWLSVLAAAMQTIRTAAQKRMTESLSTLATTYVRALLGLPLMLVYLLATLPAVGGPRPVPGVAFVAWCLVAAVTQNLGTAALLSLYKLRNFAVANQLARTNLVFTALIGWAAFSEVISPTGWLAIGLAFAGALLLNLPRGRGVAAAGDRRDGWQPGDARAVATGLLVGASFGLCNLTIREASLSLGAAAAPARGAVTVVAVTVLQVVTLGLWLAKREPGFMAGIMRHKSLAAFIGLTSALGSISWFTAFSLANASYVIAVGQVEAVFSVLVSVFYFREHVRRLDVIGIAVTLAGVVLLRMAA